MRSALRGSACAYDMKGSNHVLLMALAAESCGVLRADSAGADSETSDNYAALLGRLRFHNSGVVQSDQRFELHPVRTIYNEQYSYLGTGTEGDVTSGSQAYLYEINGSTPVPPPSFKKNYYPVNATLCSHCDRGGGDIPGLTPTAPSYDACARLCGSNPACLSWVWNQATTKCYPKSAVLTPSASGSPDFSGCSPSYPPAKCKTAPTPPAPEPVLRYMGQTPPSGMRSAVPIGCLGMGTVELRGDGALRDWRLIFNNGPEAPDNWNHKLTLEMEDAMFGLDFSTRRSRKAAIPLRTQLPPGLSNISHRPVDQLSYEGAFPTARLNVTDTRLPQGLAVSMVARGQFSVGSPDESAAPAAIFDFRFDNRAGQVDATPSAFFALPNVIGANSFKASASGKRVLVLSEGQHPIHRDGGMAVAVEGADSWAWSSAGKTSSDGVASLFESFAAGGMRNTSQANASAGAVQATILVPKGQIRVVTIVMTWYFPHRIWAGEFATDLGNFYTNHWDSAEHVAISVASNKTRSLQHALGFHATFLDTDLPLYLKDALINSAAVFTKTSMFMKDGQFRMWESHSCQDLQPPHIHFYRAQALQTLFPTLERQIPIFYNHSQVKVDNETFHGSVQALNSKGEMSWYTPHRHGNCSCGECDTDSGCPSDELCFQCMAGAIFNGHGTPGKCTAPGCISFTDESQANRVDNVFNFIMDTYMNFKWHADGADFAVSLYPGIKLAFSWLVRSSTKWGLPEGRLNTNDEHGIMGTLGSYNSIVYLSALAAVEDLAESLNDASTAAAAKTAQRRGVQAMSKLLARTDHAISGHNSTGPYFSSFWCAEGPENVTGSHALQSSIMYGYNWAMIMGLGHKLQLTNSSVASHLRAEAARNFIPATLCVDGLCPAGVRPESATLFGGVVFATGRNVTYDCTAEYKPARPFGDFTDQDYWEMANADHSSAALWARAYRTTAEAMKPTEAMIHKYSDLLHDQWDYHDVSRAYIDANAAGGLRPVVNSHYARQLNMWAIPLALSGQQFDARHPDGARLSFDRQDPSSLSRWPVLVPGSLAVASDQDAECASGLSLRLLAGKPMRLRELWLEGKLVATDVTLATISLPPSAENGTDWLCSTKRQPAPRV